MELEIKNQKLIAGLLWDWDEYNADYLPSEYKLVLILKYRTKAAITINSTQSADDSNKHNFTYSAVKSLPLYPGEYHFQLYAENLTDSTEKVPLESGTVPISVILSKSDSIDPRGYFQKLYEKLQTAYDEAADAGWVEMTINGRTVRYDREILLNELLTIKNLAKQEAREQSGKKANRNFLIKFT